MPENPAPLERERNETATDGFGAGSPLASPAARCLAAWRTAGEADRILVIDGHRYRHRCKAVGTGVAHFTEANDRSGKRV